MTLFDIETDPSKNLLPKDGRGNYYGKLLKQHEADHYLKILLSDIEWQNDEAVIFGKKIITKRKVAWYGEEPFEYTYSNTTKRAKSWTKELLELKRQIEDKTGNTFNSCLLNLYHVAERAWPGIAMAKRI